ncbi:MAG: FHA domain-containing protein [Desulfosalsimonadaceae bacterium]|nr:FHA domain-containing protein [Desulfosalsimonadaceae bacterium]
MSNQPDLKIELSLKDRVIKTYTFNQFEISVGRDPGADIFIDNTGISREHMKIEMNMGGTYVLKDMGSTNGIFLNGQLALEEPLRNNDVITLGKFSLRILIDKGDTAVRVPQKPDAAKNDIDGTTVLSREQMAQMMANLKQNPPQAAAPAPEKPSQKSSSGLIISGIAIVIIVAVIAFFVMR